MVWRGVLRCGGGVVTWWRIRCGVGMVVFVVVEWCLWCGTVVVLVGLVVMVIGGGVRDAEVYGVRSMPHLGCAGNGKHSHFSSTSSEQLVVRIPSRELSNSAIASEVDSGEGFHSRWSAKYDSRARETRWELEQEEGAEKLLRQSQLHSEETRPNLRKGEGSTSVRVGLRVRDEVKARAEGEGEGAGEGAG